MKFLKQLILTSYLLSFFTLSSHQHDVPAQTWVTTYCTSCSDEDLRTISQLLFYSLRRSECSLEAQEVTATALEQIGNASLAVAETRLNPSKKASYPFNKEIFIKNQEQCAKTLEIYFSTNAQYDAIVAAVVHSDTLHSALAKKGVKQVRADARTVVARAVNTHIDALQKTLGEAQGVVASVAQIFQKQTLPALATRSFLEYVWSVLPQFLVNSFVKFDQAYAATHAQLCAALVQEFAVGNSIWRTLEAERAAWYRAHYKALLDLINEREQMHALP